MPLSQNPGPPLGEVATYDLSNSTTTLTIDLNPGKSSIFWTTQLAVLDYDYSLHVYASGNVYNAYLFDDDPRSCIESAIGGSDNDTIIGNAVENC